MSALWLETGDCGLGTGFELLDFDLEQVVRFAEGRFYFFRIGAAGDDESEVSIPLGESMDPAAHRNRDRDLFDPFDLSDRSAAVYPTQYPIGWNRNHHRPGGLPDNPHPPSVKPEGGTQQLDFEALGQHPEFE